MNGRTICKDQKPDPLFKNQKKRKNYKQIVLELVANHLGKKETYNSLLRYKLIYSRCSLPINMKNLKDFHH